MITTNNGPDPTNPTTVDTKIGSMTQQHCQHDGSSHAVAIGELGDQVGDERVGGGRQAASLVVGDRGRADRGVLGVGDQRWWR